MADSTLSEQKQCKKCGLIKPLDIFRSSVRILANGEKRRYYGECKDCHAEYIRSRPASPARPATGEYVLKPRIPVEKNCRVCGELKPAGDFHSHRYITNQGKLSVRLDSDCKLCVAEARKQAEARARENSASRKRRRENPELMKAWLARRRAKYKPVVAEKECSKCKTVKPASAFYRKLINNDGLHSQCRSCVFAVSHEYYRTIEPHRAGRWKSASQLKNRYGITLDEYEWLASAQDNKCLICGDKDVLLHVDHCHNSGRIRGLLCRHCNIALGLLRENKAAATEMVRYIELRCR